MFEYYTYQLSNKLKSENEPREQVQVRHFLGIKVWGIAGLLAMILSFLILFSFMLGALLFIALFIGMIAVLIWLTVQMTGCFLKDILKKIPLLMLLLLVGVVSLAIVVGLVSVLVHEIMVGMYHVGQIANMIDLVTRGLILLLSPVVLVFFFRFIQEKKVFIKIKRQLYVELLIVLTLGLIMGQIPHVIVLTHLFLTQIVQFICLLIINTLLITTVLTVCHHREVLR